jgi:predicted nucleic acid-binding protein
VRLVVDASVVAQRLVTEPDTPKARSLLLRWSKGDLDLLAPELLAVEIGNMLWKRALRKLLPENKVLRLYSEFQELQIPLWPSAGLMEAALRLALRQQHPVYDCVYVVLASETDSELVTADEKLYRTFRAVLPRIQLLREWSRTV